MDKQITVDILTPFYKEPLWMLKRNIESVASQKTDYNFRHIIVIDNPKVPSEVLNYLYVMQEQYEIDFFIHEQNFGLSGARNTALEESNGKYIMLLDTDDTFAPGKIQLQIDYMEENNFDMTWGGFKEIHSKGVPVGADHIPNTTGHIKELTSLRNPCPCGSTCFKREIYKKIGGFDEAMKEGAEDMEYWYRIMSNGYRMAGISKVLYYLGIHDSNMTAKLINNGGFTRANNYIRKKYPNENWLV